MPIGSMYGIYANIGGILMVNVTIYSIHGSYGYSILYLYMCVPNRNGLASISVVHVQSWTAIASLPDGRLQVLLRWGPRANALQYGSPGGREACQMM